MRIRVTLEYDSDETFGYEIEAWRCEEIGYADIAELAKDDSSYVARIEMVE